MYTFSAADAISPSIQRTKEFLFRQFSWGTFLKLGLVALITEGFGSNFQSSSRGGHPSGGGSASSAPFHLTPELVAVIVAVSIAVLLLSFLVLYLITRLRFAFFHCLITNTKMIRPGWRLYASQATRFFWLNVAVGFCFLVLVAAVALPFVAGFMRLFRETPPGGRPDVAALLSLVLPLIPIIFLVVLAALLADLILRDFLLPHFALENAAAGQAWSAVWENISAEKGQFFVYLLLRIILPTIAVIGLFIVLIIPGLVLAGAFAMVEIGIHSAFADSTGGAALAGILLQVFFGLIAFGFALLISICLGGPLSTWIREYALVFYGGRYQALGDILFPPTPLAPVSPSI